MEKVLTKGNWPEVAVKLKHISHLIKKYAERVSSQAERQLALINAKEPVRDVDNASNMETFESLPLHTLLPHQLCSLNTSLMDFEIYVQIDANLFMESFSGWQRYESA